jgi:hypothetical protein
MSAKKKGALTLSQTPEKRKLEDVTFELLFQRSLPSLDGIIMSSQDIKLYSLTVGSHVTISSGSSLVICTVWASKLGQAGVIIMSKALQPNFDVEVASLKGKISSDFRRY